jgi:hypothetical protein
LHQRRTVECPPHSGVFITHSHELCLDWPLALRDRCVSGSPAESDLGGPVEHFIGHYGPYCDYCLARWQAATMFDYCMLLAMIVTGGWVTSRMQSR